VHNSDELDLLLDSALATYADPGPGSGLEQRILTRISAETAPAPRRRRLWWAIALPAAACLLLVFLSTPKHPHPPSGRTEQAHPSQEAPFIATHTGSRPAHHLEAPQRSEKPTRKTQSEPITLAAKPVPYPKLDVFPTPRPLTHAEQALAVFAARAPEPERESLVETQKQLEEPLHIAAIHIPPLEPPDQGTN
jgi:hypothetical protein